MNILITGVAGYIGSDVVKQIRESTKYKITILDNLSTGSINTINTFSNSLKYKMIGEKK